ncbi:MAG: hypothetical protein E6R03_17295 [Hyphomicrobiaceae bacterium]|nr:hypothetical protein [Anaerolineae bacterium]TXH09008.1 MAG: hypothetical protein E6R03_17295 [Hyphomicrobiaceae bacterium]
MSYKIDFNAADVNWQIDMLKLFPKIANQYFYPAMHRATSEIKGAIEPNIPVRTGLAKSEFRKAVSGKGLNITGRVGWKYGTKAWYINVHEYGAPPHAIGYVPSLNVTIKKHPGVPALKFMERGQEQADDKVNPEMARAAEAVVNHLARK